MTKTVWQISAQGVYNLHTESAEWFVERWEINGYADIEKIYEIVMAGMMEHIVTVQPSAGWTNRIPGGGP